VTPTIAPENARRAAIQRLARAALACVLAIACAASEPEDGGSETHFLRPCVEDIDCTGFDEPHLCADDGYCRPESEVTQPSACMAPLSTPEDVLILGDSVLELSEFSGCLETRAASEGRLPADAHYRDSASALTSFLAEGAFSLHEQYATARDAGPARLVIMNGGATDMLQLNCPMPVADDCPAVQAALSGARLLFARMAEDGVARLAYLFYPDPVDNTGLKAGLDTLRPLLENACAQSPIPCLWIDLRPTFASGSDYFGDDGIVFSQAGACAAADTLFSALAERCPAAQ
jgi:hypothetical protein